MSRENRKSRSGSGRVGSSSPTVSRQVAQSQVTQQPVATAVNPAEGLTDASQSVAATVEENVNAINNDALRSAERQLYYASQTASQGAALSNANARIGAANADVMNRLGKAFGSFFTGLGGAAIDYGVAKEIARREEENKALQVQGELDSRLGSVNEDLYNSSSSYATAYDKQYGKMHGRRMADEFNSFAKQLPATIDARTAIDSYLQESLKGHEDISPIALNSMLEAFSSGTASTVSQHEKDSISYVLAGTKDVMQQNVFSIGKSGDYTVDDVLDLQRDAAEVYIDNPQDARAAVTGSLMEGALSGGKGSIQKFLTTLTSPGWGPNNESFADLFPKEYDELEAKLDKEWMNRSHYTANSAYRAVDQSMTLYNSQKKYASWQQRVDHLTEIHTALEKAAGQYGETGKYFSLKEKFAKEFAEVERFETNVRVLDDHIKGNSPGYYPGDKLIDETQSYYLKNVMRSEQFPDGIDPLKDATSATVASGLIFMAGGMAKDIKEQMNFALTDKLDKEKTVVAYSFWKSLHKQNPEFAHKYMNAESKRVFNTLDRLTAGNSSLSSVTTALEKFSSMQDLDTLVKNTDIKTMTGFDPDEQGAKRKAITKINTDIREKLFAKYVGSTGILDALAGPDEEDIIIDPALEENMLYNLKAYYSHYNGAGMNDPYETALDDVVNQLTQVDVIPVGNGKMRVNYVKTPRSSERAYFGRQVFNPDTLENEDTLENFRSSVSDANDRVGFTEDVDDVFILPGQHSVQGLYDVYVDGSSVPLMYSAGESTVNGKLLPDNTKEAKAQLKESFGEGFDFIEFQPGVFKVVAMATFKGKPLASINEQEAEFTRKREAKQIEEELKQFGVDHNLLVK